MTVLGLVPARGGSKGIPDKNVRPLAGRPLLAYTADAAREAGCLDRVIVSTDSERIAEVARGVGLEVPFLRPDALAGDDTPMRDVIAHALEALAAGSYVPDVIVLLQPTSPLRRGAHIAQAVDLLRATGADAVASVTAVPRHLSPDYVMRIEDGRLVNFLADGSRVTRRQDAREAFVRDGTVYAFRHDAFARDGSIYGQDCRPLFIDPAESLSLDTPDDWAQAERRLAGPAR